MNALFSEHFSIWDLLHILSSFKLYFISLFSARKVFTDTGITTILNQDFFTLIFEEYGYIGKGSGFTLQSIDGLLLAIYKKYLLIFTCGWFLYVWNRKTLYVSDQINNINNNNYKTFFFLAKHETGDNEHTVEIDCTEA